MLTLSLDPAPSPDLRASFAREINAFHSRTIPADSTRRAFLLHDQTQTLAAGLIFTLSWQYLFVEALWVADAHRREGHGQTLLAQAEAHALAHGCHSAWLDTFQARDFYLRRGYQVFGALPDYPAGQTRYFLTKRLR